MVAMFMAVPLTPIWINVVKNATGRAPVLWTGCEDLDRADTGFVRSPRMDHPIISSAFGGFIFPLLFTHFLRARLHLHGSPDLQRSLAQCVASFSSMISPFFPCLLVVPSSEDTPCRRLLILTVFLQCGMWVVRLRSPGILCVVEVVLFSGTSCLAFSHMQTH